MTETSVMKELSLIIFSYSLYFTQFRFGVDIVDYLQGPSQRPHRYVRRKALQHQLRAKGC